jgi:putative component of membrane protein insertase Oxa1/YidC/SpoIIIJ protein YidD
MSTYSLDLLARRGAIAGIEAYQRHLSPRKGFDCPHRVLYQSASCADYMKRVLERQSLAQAIQIAPRRFRACQQAATTLQSQMSRQDGGCIVIPCCIPI